MADPIERYLEHGLRLGRHAEDLVDSYYGPTELASRIEAEEPREPAALAVEAVVEQAVLDAAAASPEEAREYSATWSLQPAERVAKQVDSQLRSTSPPYQHTYWQGHELVSAYVGGDPARLRELLTARVLPSVLAESA